MSCKRKKEIFIQEKPEDCIICTEKLEEDKSLDCGHWIHYKCIEKQFKSECPVCRVPLNIKVKGYRPSEEFNNDGIVGDVVERWFEEEIPEDLQNPEAPRVILDRYGYVRELLYEVIGEDEYDDNVNEEEYDEENPRGDSVYYD